MTKYSQMPKVEKEFRLKQKAREQARRRKQEKREKDKLYGKDVKKSDRGNGRRKH